MVVVEEAEEAAEMFARRRQELNAAVRAVRAAVAAAALGQAVAAMAMGSAGSALGWAADAAGLAAAAMAAEAAYNRCMLRCEGRRPLAADAAA